MYEFEERRKTVRRTNPILDMAYEIKREADTLSETTTNMSNLSSQIAIELESLTAYLSEREKKV